MSTLAATSAASEGPMRVAGEDRRPTGPPEGVGPMAPGIPGVPPGPGAAPAPPPLHTAAITSSSSMSLSRRACCSLPHQGHGHNRMD